MNEKRDKNTYLTVGDIESLKIATEMMRVELKKLEMAFDEIIEMFEKEINDPQP